MKINKSFEEVREAFTTLCDAITDCAKCPFYYYDESCTALLINKPEEVFKVLFPPEEDISFKRKILKTFPDFDFNGVCVQSFFKGKIINEENCAKYSSCLEHYACCTEQDILEELEGLEELKEAKILF